MQVLTYNYAVAVATRSDSTKKRLLDAACDEFSARGIAGARTGRIASAASVNEALIFRYFGSKQGLFDKVYDLLVVQTVEDVPIDATNLPGYAGALFDYYRDREQVLRLSVWMALESLHAPVAPAVIRATTEKEAAIREAQRNGHVTDDFEPGELLALVIQLSLAGASVMPAIGQIVDPSLRRANVIAAVSRLVQPL